MYRTEPDGTITRIDGAQIPKDITNPAYVQYLHWVQHKQYIGPELPKDDEQWVEPESLDEVDILLDPGPQKDK